MPYYGLRVKGRNPFKDMKMVHSVVMFPAEGAGTINLPEAESVNGQDPEFLYTIAPIYAYNAPNHGSSDFILRRSELNYQGVDVSHHKLIRVGKIEWRTWRENKGNALPYQRMEFNSFVAGLIIFKELNQPKRTVEP